ncbi:MAG: hypothetical protein KIT67_05895 [Alphaproteobacteria bacterium]|nr:hypothetical protein [Alphaproteobacteria bacterium]
MTRELAIERLQAEASRTDIESAHLAADEVLCDLLKALGYTDVVDAYNKVIKWYA